MACESAVRSFEKHQLTASKDENRMVYRQKFFALEPRCYNSLNIWMGLKKRLPS